MANGIPALLSGVVRNAPALIEGAVESAIWSAIAGPNRWGVYLASTTTVAVAVDSVVSVDWGRESPTSEYRIESGSFSSFNKVQKAREVKIMLAKGTGGASARTAFLQWLEANVSSTALFDISVPEGFLQGLTLQNYHISRTQRGGASIINAMCIFKEIRQTSPLYYNSGTPSTDTTNAVSPSDAPSKPTAAVQPTNPLTSTLNIVQSKIASFFP